MFEPWQPQTAAALPANLTITSYSKTAAATTKTDLTFGVHGYTCQTSGTSDHDEARDGALLRVLLYD